jgi:nicotinamide-nucleotide amidase
MNIAILTIGNELTTGRIQDANAVLIARTARARGWRVPVMMTVGDRTEAIGNALHHLLPLADAVIITGGLGPTADDITTEAVARAFGLDMYTDEAALAHIRGIFERYRLKWTDNNAKQARFPAGAEVIPNPTGTAPGFAVRTNGKIVAVIPGVPAEAQRMLPEGLLPLLARAFPEAAPFVRVRTFKSFGLSEAAADQALADLDFEARGIDIGFYPNFPENHIVLTARHVREDVAEAALADAAEKVEVRLARHIFARDDETMEGVVGALLAERKLTLAVAESCTGGLISDRLTDVPGSSAYFERGLVTYSNEAKRDLLGVPEDVLDRFGAVSEETARRMAEGVRRLAGVDLGLASTGIAGPSGGTEEKPVGTVFIALADGRETRCRRHVFRWNRRRNKMLTAQTALFMLLRHLKGERDDD